jgi:hypothetical protein
MDHDHVSAEEWAVAIRNLLHGADSGVFKQTVERELHHVLIEFWHDLPGDPRGRFGQGLALTFASTPVVPATVADIYHLLQALSYSRPLEALSVLRHKLYDCSLQGLRYAETDLEDLLLVTTSKYGFDPDFCRHLDFLISQTTDFRRALILFRLGSYSTEQRLTTAFGGALRLVLNSAVREQQLIRVLSGVCDRRGWQWLLDWLNSFARDKNGGSLSPSLCVAIADLAQHQHQGQPDAYSILVCANLRSFLGLVEPDLLWNVANQIQTIEREYVLANLRRIWLQIVPLIAENELPWYIEDLQRENVFRERAGWFVLFSRVGDPVYVPEEGSEALAILEQASSTQLVLISDAPEGEIS